MSTAAGRTKLHLSMKQLKIRWEEVQEHWQDGVSRKFQENHLDPIEPEVLSAIRGMDRIAEVIAAAQADCSEHR